MGSNTAPPNSGQPEWDGDPGNCDDQMAESCESENWNHFQTQFLNNWNLVSADYTPPNAAILFNWSGVGIRLSKQLAGTQVGIALSSGFAGRVAVGGQLPACWPGPAGPVGYAHRF